MIKKDHSRIPAYGKRGWWLWSLIVAAWTLLVWSNSLRPGTQSAAQSSAVMELLAPLLAVMGLDQTVWHTLVRKAAHMTEFALLAMFWMALLNRRQGSGGGWRQCADVAGLCMLTALTDETIQAFVPGRGSLVTDVWIDTLGSVIGIGLSCGVDRLLRRTGRRDKDRQKISGDL